MCSYRSVPYLQTIQHTTVQIAERGNTYREGTAYRRLIFPPTLPLLASMVLEAPSSWEQVKILALTSLHHLNRVVNIAYEVLPTVLFAAATVNDRIFISRFPSNISISAVVVILAKCKTNLIRKHECI